MELRENIGTNKLVELSICNLRNPTEILTESSRYKGRCFSGVIVLG